MEGQYVPPTGEPQKVKNRKPRTRNPTVDTNPGVPGQQPPISKSNLGTWPPPQQPEVVNWAYNHGDEYGNADPASYYPEHYGYSTGEHVDAHGYGTGEYVDAHGYGTGEHVDAGQGYGYGGAQAYAGQDYDYGGAHADAGQGHGYEYGQEYGYDGAQADAGQGHGYEYGQEYGYGGAQADAGKDYGYVAPPQQVKRKAKKSRNPLPVADGGEHQGAGYENQGDGYGQPVQVEYTDGYAYPEAYNAVVPEQQANRNPQKPESKYRKPTRTKSMENGNQGAGESTLASRAAMGESDGVGSARSSGSNQSKADRSDRSVNADATSSHHHHRLEKEGTTPRLNAIARDHREGGSGRSNPERRKQKLHNEGSGAKPVAANARDQTTGMPEPPRARSSLDEWMKKQGDMAGAKIQQDESLIVFDDHDKSELETHMFGAPLATKQSIQQPPPVEEQWGTPQYQKPRENHQHQVPDLPLYQPVRQRRPYANPPLPHAYHNVQPVEAHAIQGYNAEGNKQALPLAEPNAKCMACVHGVGVPMARLATRIACRQCAMCCTIL